MLRSWLRVHAPRDAGLALVALGSYARREVCPRSDVDLLLLHDGWGKADLEKVVREVCYPLWDAGLQVGYAVHTPREAVRQAGDRLDTTTTLMDRRLVAGDPGPLDRVASSYGRWLRRRSGRLLAQLAAADEERHRRAGRRPGMLEPELKAGAGGLRDLHSLRWAAGAVLGELGLDPLVGARYLGADDRRALARANADLLATRCAVHLVDGGQASADTLRLDLQDEVAARTGAADRDEVLATVGLAMRTIAHVHGRTWPLLLADARSGRRRRRRRTVSAAEGVGVVDGLVELTDDADLRTDPGLGMRAMAVAADEGSHLGRAAVTRLQRGVADVGRLPWDQWVRGAFLAALRRGPDALPALADADHIGLLAAHLPEWQRVRGRPQRNPYHRFDLDTHLLETVAWVRRIADGELGPQAAAVHERLDESDVLLLAALLHDVGKAWEGDHADVGARVAARWVTEMGFDQRRAQRVARLVRLHLLLPDVAQHRDLDDRAEIQAVADAAIDTETLDALLVLSLADARATGPSAHSPWKDRLLVELHARARRALTGGVAAVIAEPDEKVRAARDRVDDAGSAGLERLLADPPSRYLLAADVDRIATHARLLQRAGVDASRDGVPAAQVAVQPGNAPTTTVVDVVADDRRGLLADVVGALAGCGYDVLEARAFTRGDRVVLDWFVVRPRPTAMTVATGDLAATVEAAACGTVDVDALVARQERRWDERPDAHAVLIDPAVTVDRSSGWTRVEVEGRDASGVLYRLLRVLAGAGLDVTGARVATLGPQVRDVFFVDDGAVDDTVVDRMRAVVGADVPDG